MEQEYPGHLIVVMGPTGSGKGTVMSHAHTIFPELHETISCTTRTPRPGEQDGVEYYFLTPEVFTERIEAGDFIEWAWFGSNRYGTLKSEILPRLEAGELVLTEIELQGVQQLLELLPRESITIVYIEAGSWENLATRARKRAPMSDEELASRHERYLAEVQAKPLADIVINNTGEDFTLAQEEFISIIRTIKDKFITRQQ